jgi:hypothetical protein
VLLFPVAGLAMVPGQGVLRRLQVRVIVRVTKVTVGVSCVKTRTLPRLELLGQDVTRCDTEVRTRIERSDRLIPNGGVVEGQRWVKCRHGKHERN